MSQTSPWSQDDRSPPVYARDNQNIPILILEAILLSTFVPGENNIPDKGFTRPLYVSPTALSSGFLNSSTENLYQVTDGDVLVNFAGTLSSFSVVFRVVGLRPEKQIRLSIHETVRSAKSSDPILTHHSVEFMGSHYPSNSVVKIYSTHPAPVFQSCTKENSSEINGPVVKLIQIFDQSRRLLFSQEWLLEIGTLNEDAISWLRDLHCSLDPWLEDLSQPSMIFNHLQNNFAGSAAKSPKTDSYNVQNHSALSFNEDKKFEFSGESSIEELTDDEKFVSDDSKSLKMIHSGSASTIRSHSSFLEIIKENDCKSDHQFFSRSSSISEILNETNSGILDEFEISNSSKDIETNQTPKTVVDMFHQLGFWLYGTRVGQLLTRNQRSSVNKSSIKTFYSLETIWLLGHKFLNDRSDTPLIVNMLPIEKLVVSPNNLHALRLHPHLHNQFKISTGDFFFSEILLLPLTLSKHMQHLRSLLVDGCKWSPISDDSESDHLLHLNLSEIKSETCISAQSPSSIAKITLQTWTRTIAGSNKILAYLVVQSKPQEQEKARAVFIDFLNEIMALCAGERAAIQFVFKQALNCKVEVGPHPRSLIHVNKNICKPGSITNNMNYSVSSIEEKPYKDEAKVTKGLIVLLWSEHISDWIERAFSIKFRTRNPKRPVLTIQSTVHPLIGLVEIDLLASTVFFFSDATLRFAVSFSSNTWLCLRATSIEDFTALLTYVPFLMRTLDENFSSESLPKSLSKKIISESTIEIMTLSPRNFSSSMESLDGLLPQKTPLMPHLQNSPTLESPLHRESDENIILKSEEKEDVVVGGFREFESAFYRCFWFTYRRDMPRLSPSILTSDAGFGCMIRAGQSMMAEAAAIVTFGTRHWRLDQVYNDPIASLKYRSILSMFLDIPDSSAPFSIHNIVTTGVRIGTPIGQFFGPSTLSRALRRICDQWYISRNASISEESNFPATLLEDSSLSKSSNLIDFQSNLTLNELKPAKVSPRKTSKTIDIMHQMPFGYPELIPEIIDDCSIIDARIFPKKDSSVELPKHQKADEKNVPILGVTIWRHGLIRVEALKTAIAGRGPQVLLLPLRLGTYFINEKEYSPLVHASLSCPHSLGVIGGKSKRAFYIVGYQGSSLLYLDPHVIRAAVEVDLDRAVKSREFHCQKVCEMSLKDLDPSVLLCFLCQSPSDVDDVSHMLSTVPLSMPLFSF